MAGSVELPLELWQIIIGSAFYTGGFIMYVKFSIRAVDRELEAHSKRADVTEQDVKELRENRVRPEHIKELREEVRKDIDSMRDMIIEAIKSATIERRRDRE